MKTVYLRICRLLASSGFSDHEIAEFAQEASRVPPQTLVDDVVQLRRLIKDSVDERIFDVPSNTSSQPSSDVEIKIERLLILDAGLPRTRAVEEMTSVIQSRFAGVSVPPMGKKGFRVWIQKLTTFIPEKELLHIATNLRNRMVHEAPSDWRLK